MILIRIFNLTYPENIISLSGFDEGGEGNMKGKRKSGDSGYIDKLEIYAGKFNENYEDQIWISKTPNHFQLITGYVNPVKGFEYNIEKINVETLDESTKIKKSSEEGISSYGESKTYVDKKLITLKELVNGLYKEIIVNGEFKKPTKTNYLDVFTINIMNKIKDMRVDYDNDILINDIVKTTIQSITGQPMILSINN